MTESSFLDPTRQLIREMQRRVRDLEEQNDLLRRYLVMLRDDLVSANFTRSGDNPP